MQYSLFETMLLYKDSIFLFRLHLQRLYKSAKALGFIHNHLESFLYNLPTQHNITRNLIQSLQLLGMLNIPNIPLAQHIIGLESCMKQNIIYPHLWDDVEHLIALLKKNQCNTIALESNTSSFMLCRLTLSSDGCLSFALQELKPITNTKINLSTADYDTTPLSYHKTTQRSHFNNATQSISNNEYFDYVYMNASSRLIEGSRSNILVAKNGKYYTPESSIGLLSGTLRDMFIFYGICEEKILYKADLYNADTIYCLNSVRGLIPVTLL